MSPTRTVAGLCFHCPSPSIYSLEGLPIAVIFLENRMLQRPESGWYVAEIRSGEIWNVRPFASIVEAAECLAKALKTEGAA